MIFSFEERLANSNSSTDTQISETERKRGLPQTAARNRRHKLKRRNKASDKLEQIQKTSGNFKAKSIERAKEYKYLSVDKNRPILGDDAMS